MAAHGRRMRRERPHARDLQGGGRQHVRRGVEGPRVRQEGDADGGLRQGQAPHRPPHTRRQGRSRRGRHRQGAFRDDPARDARRSRERGGDAREGLHEGGAAAPRTRRPLLCRGEPLRRVRSARSAHGARHQGEPPHAIRRALPGERRELRERPPPDGLLRVLVYGGVRDEGSGQGGEVRERHDLHRFQFRRLHRQSQRPGRLRTHRLRGAGGQPGREPRRDRPGEDLRDEGQRGVALHRHPSLRQLPGRRRVRPPGAARGDLRRLRQALQAASGDEGGRAGVQ